MKFFQFLIIAGFLLQIPDRVLAQKGVGLYV